MGTLLHFKNIYLAAFENCKPEFVVVFLKIYSVFCVAMLSMALYAFAFRAFTGFEF
ncbi:MULTISPECIES: DUF6747 family protein [unclassified Arenibacter]|uniref:DUF6747 family protein n=1 Tax=unclassified Arenibacter TaxID=2615047 RepID=UPI000D9C26A8|nr:DUF6747 family protein [Arenibacter sp. ARW7G5Y1]PXX26781.1 hypothetical protein C7972_10875 [Arenibacter sp. ARW7G5Y1]